MSHVTRNFPVVPFGVSCSSHATDRTDTICGNCRQPIRRRSYAKPRTSHGFHRTTLEKGGFLCALESLTAVVCLGSDNRAALGRHAIGQCFRHGCVPAGAASSFSVPTALPELIPTRHLLFAIPFSFDPSTTQRGKWSSCSLYVSSDRGAHWQPYAKLPPSEKAVSRFGRPSMANIGS